MTDGRPVARRSTPGRSTLRSCSGCWRWPRSCACPTSRRGAHGTPTRATTCSCSARSCSDGVVPLLGPPTSIGDFHHGALYYFLLAPAALLTGGDSPLAVTFAIALAGIAAVGVDLVARASDRRLGRRVRRGPAHGRLVVGGPGVDLHLEPEPHRPLERGGARRRLARVDDPAGALVAPGGRWGGRHDAVPRARRDAPADRRGAARRRCPPARAGSGPPDRPGGRLGRARDHRPDVHPARDPRSDDRVRRDECRARLASRRWRTDRPIPARARRRDPGASRQLAADGPAHRRARPLPCSPCSSSARSCCGAGAAATTANASPSAGWASGCCGRPDS